ncbi:chromatin assembly factor 1 subunit A-like [Leptidea sinapis]|uniref:chromatin assembly factor 1 subunit A-like n=1 Tax=Leptidea sinapis TaxID=189913 RepID=UPI0021C3EDE4|nr:chromatin assembly factor 1 subunit A-like [Leptidea sinapis]
MKTHKSPESEVTPSKKKLKQARLPFKIITEDSPKSDSTVSRKRKLTTPEPVPVTKIGKVTKENEVADEMILISDDDSKECIAPVSKGTTKILNPYVKLVDAVRKKKLQKSKASKRRKSNSKLENGLNKNEIILNGTLNEDKRSKCEEQMDIDEDQAESDDTKTLDKDSVQLNEVNEKIDSAIIIEDSNGPFDTNCVNNKTDIEVIKNSTEKSEDVINFNIDNSSKNETNESPKTPKRITRNKTNKNNVSLNTSQINKTDESLASSPNTTKQSTRSSSVTKSEGDVSITESNNLNITPKQLNKKNESAKKKAERENERQEKEKKRQQEKEERARLKQEKEDQKKKEREEKEEAKRKEKEEKEEQKRKEREEKEKQKELEKKLKDEKEEQKRKEREEKEEQKRKEKEAKEDEKRKRQEALELEKQEQEQKKKRESQAFVSFFVPKQKIEKDQKTVECISHNNMLSNFTIKLDMRLAPTTRSDLTEDRKQGLDMLLKSQDQKQLYLSNIKDGTLKPLSSGKTWPLGDKDDDVMIIEDELPPTNEIGEIIACDSAVREKLRPKLLSFHENRRPPYWGTWRKRSVNVKPRQPFGQDKKFDYEVDSDEEWEEEEGESIDGSVAGSDDEQGPDEYEVDNEVFVPHGYLSDEEATMGDDDVLSLSPEAQKARLKHLGDEFETELRKPTEKLKPRVYGLLWQAADGGKPEHCTDALWNYFSKFSMILNDPTPFLQPSVEQEMTEKKKVKKKKTNTETEQKIPSAEKKKKLKQDKESKKPEKIEKKSQPGINTFLTKFKAS